MGFESARTTDPVLDKLWWDVVAPWHEFLSEPRAQAGSQLNQWSIADGRGDFPSCSSHSLQI